MMQVAIIEGDDSTCRALSRLVRAAGFEARGFHSAETFLANPNHGGFGCLLVHIRLGGMSGLELFRELRERHVPTPVMFITPVEDPAARTEAVESGSAGFFHQSDPDEMIIEALRRVAVDAL